MTPLDIPNRDARRLWLHANGLSTAPTGPLDVMSTIRQLGFVQLDSIQIVSRAHHHILWSRNNNYREPMLDKLLAKDRAVFEHFTHDASVIPMEFRPFWARRYKQLEKKVRQWDWHKGMLDARGRNAIKQRIREEGALSTQAFDTKVKGERAMWRRPPHKLALDYMWYAGELSTCHRQNFTKFYDLTERIVPESILNDHRPEPEQVDWLCAQALQRLGFATEGDLQRFWDATSKQEVADWLSANEDCLVPVRIETASGDWRKAWAPANIENQLASAPAPTSRLRILSPFDPAIRDRNRLQRLFGFEYTIEIFVPAAKRRWGYYVFPILEGDRFIGRIEVKADRSAGALHVKQVWIEPGLQWTGSRRQKLHTELTRLARFTGVEAQPSCFEF